MRLQVNGSSFYGETCDASRTDGNIDDGILVNCLHEGTMERGQKNMTIWDG